MLPVAGTLLELVCGKAVCFFTSLNLVLSTASPSLTNFSICSTESELASFLYQSVLSQTCYGTFVNRQVRNAATRLSWSRSRPLQSRTSVPDLWYILLQLVYLPAHQEKIARSHRQIVYLRKKKDTERHSQHHLS